MHPDDPPAPTERTAPAGSQAPRDEAGVRSDTSGSGRPKRRRAVRLGVGDESPGRSTEHADVGWHESAGDLSNDEQLKRDVPPHW